MDIPEHQLSSIKRSLNHLVDERTSAPWASYSGDEHAIDEQDREDIERIKTVADVYEWLRDQGRQKSFVEWAHCLDPLDGFEVEGKNSPDEKDETAFRAYLERTYGLFID
jgi:hypothetical protein